jgi:hypothetical protein
MVVFDLNLFPSSITWSQHCRNLIHSGYDPQTPIKFVRGQTPIFNETFSPKAYVTSCPPQTTFGWILTISSIKRVTILLVVSQHSLKH